MNESINSSLAGRHLEAARSALGSLRGTAEAGPTTRQADVLVSIQTTLEELAQVGRLLGLGAVGPARVPCGSCGGMIMPAATLCLFCWRTRIP
jgi:hypothetical protein